MDWDIDSVTEEKFRKQRHVAVDTWKVYPARARYRT